MELTTLPARLGNQQLVRKYRDYLSHSENIALFPLDVNIADYVITNHLAWRRLEETGVKIILVEEM